MRKASLLCTLILFANLSVMAQDEQPEMADTLRSNGKIYVLG